MSTDGTPPMKIYGNTVVHVGYARTDTVLHDGKIVPAVPHDTDIYRATALRLGYGADTAALCIEHEIAHVALAHFLMLPESPVMRAVADGDFTNAALLDLEEAAVLAVQAFSRVAGGRIQ